jgi:TonB family protein
MCATVCAHAADRAVRHIVAPDYARLARIANLQGTVSVQVEIAPDGRIISAKAEGGHPLLQRAAEDNVRTWVFEAKTERSIQTIRYRYVLEGKQTYEEPHAKVVFDLPSEVEIRSNPYEPQPQRAR